jgi:acetyltransferase-like isoleucine patch superfamily enzyme
MYATLEDFTAAVGRLGELRSEGLLTLRVSVSGQVDFAVDKDAADVPPRADGLYRDIYDVLGAMARGVDVDGFVRARQGDELEPETVSRAKYAFAAGVFPPTALRAALPARLRAGARGLLASVLIGLGRSVGRLGMCMSVTAFRRMIGPDGRRAAWGALGAQIDPTAYIAAGVWIRIPKQLKVGPGTQLGGRCMIESYGPVTIGRNVVMNDTDVYTAQHLINDPGFNAERLFVTIGDYAWLPHKIILLPGVTVGSHAVIGTGSVVKRDIPDYGVAVGNPARVIKERARIPYTYVPTSHHRAPMIG